MQRVGSTLTKGTLPHTSTLTKGPLPHSRLLVGSKASVEEKCLITGLGVI